MATDGRLIFKSRRTSLPPLIVTASMQRDAWQADRAAAALRCDTREVHRIEAEARAGNLAHLDRRQA